MMTELAAGFATLSLFLFWRLVIAKKKAQMACTLLDAMVEGRLKIKRVKDGYDMEIIND